MKVEVSVSGRSGSSRSPGYVLRKWVIIGAVIGALLVGFAGAMILGVAMIAGAAAGTVFGAVFGLFKAAMAVVRRG